MPILPDGFTYEVADTVEWPATNVRRIPDVTIDHTLGQPSAAQFEAGENTDTDDPPVVGEAVALAFGSGPTLLTGEIQKTTQIFEDRHDQLKWSAQVADTTLQLNRRLPIVCYTNISATTAIADLLDTYAPDFTTTFVQSSLPNVTVQFDGSKTLYQCLEEIAAQLTETRFYLDGFDLHFFTGVDPTGSPATIDENNQDLLHDPPVAYTEDITQLRTRVYGKGASAKLIADLSVGDTTLFVDSNDLFDSGGGKLFVSPCQVIEYTGKSVLSIPQYRANSSGGLSAAVDNDALGEAYGYPTTLYFETVIKYRCTYVKDGLESNAAEASAVLDRAGVAELSSVNETLGGSVEAGSYLYFATVQDSAGNETQFTGSGNGVTVNSPNNAVTGQIVDGGFSSKQTKVNIYRVADFGTYANQIFRVLQVDITGSPTFPINWTDGYSSASLTQRRTDFEEARANGWAVTGRSGGKVTLTVPLGPTGTTARRIYRSDDNGTTWYLRTTLSDNSTVSFVDTAANEFPDQFDFTVSNNWVDSPGEDESPGPLPSLKKAVLTGVTGVIEDAPAGSDVSLWVQRDDVDAQIEIAEKEGGDGVHEYLMTDTNLDTYAKLNARCDIELALYSRPLKSVRYSTRDRESKIGRLVTFDLPAGSSGKGVFGTFLIQQVNVDQIHENDTLVERYNVSASGARFTLQDLMQRVVLLQDNGSSPVTGFTGGGGGGGSLANSVTEAELAFTDITVADVTSTKHGLAPKSPADATKFLNGAATPAYAQVKDSDLSTSDVTTNNASGTKHGFAPKSPGDATKFLNGAATPAFAQVKDSDLSTSDITTNDADTTKHGFMKKFPGGTSTFLRADGAFASPAGGGDVSGPGAAVTGDNIVLWDGTSGTLIKDSGVAIGAITGAGRLIGIQRITTTGAGTYTPAAGTSFIIMELQGGGGGGGGVAQPTGSNAQIGGGGSGGGWLRKKLTANFSGASYSVGAKGTGGSSGANPGNNGSNTTFTDTAGSPTTYTAGGGTGGAAGANFTTTAFGPSTAGGTVTNGDDQVPGGPSRPALALSATSAHSGAGGTSHYSNGSPDARITAANTSAAGVAAGGKGGGGSGAAANGTGAAQAGGDGSDGMIIIWEYS